MALIHSEEEYRVRCGEVALRLYCFARADADDRSILAYYPGRSPDVTDGYGLMCILLHLPAGEEDYKEKHCRFWVRKGETTVGLVGDVLYYIW